MVSDELLSGLLTRLRLDPAEVPAEDRTAAEEAVNDAIGLVMAEVPAVVAARWETALPSVVYTVTLKAARREYENPNGYTSESLGEHSAGIAAWNATGAYLTAREAAQVRRAAGLPERRATGFVGSVRTPSAYAEGKS